MFASIDNPLACCHSYFVTNSHPALVPNIFGETLPSDVHGSPKVMKIVLVGIAYSCKDSPRLHLGILHERPA